MRFGFALPQIGAFAGPDALVTVATRAEELGYDSVWVLDRVLAPLDPRAPYPPSADGSLPEPFKRVLDPLETLTFVAAHTSRVALGTSVLNLPYYNPVLLARQLTTVDVLSGGRLRVGFGQGWSPDEFEAVGTPMRDRGRRADEFIQVLKKIWTENPVEFEGEFYRVPKSMIDLKPVQQPHPPIYLAAYSPGALDRVGRLADGWNPAGIPIEGMAQMFAGIKETARAAGRDPDALEFVVRAAVYPSASPLGDDRFVYTGSAEQIKADIAATREIGAAELFFEVLFTPGVDSLDKMVTQLEQLWELAQAA